MSAWRALCRFVAVHRLGTCLLAALLPLLLRVMLLPYLPIPEPQIHDEFSYLLGADTFLHGRLANPPHPMWVHFETAHVNQQPTYVTKYQPGQSLLLAFGQKVLGHPWFGVLLSVGVMCGSICWMLQGWLPPRFAALGSLLAILQFGVTSYWMNSYWGGALGGIGGALVLGALPRLVRRPGPSAAVAGAAGAALLSISRPYEGLVLVVAATAALLWWRRKEGRPFNDLLTVRHTAAAAILLCLFCSWMGYYNYRVTGKPWLFPYVVNNRAYVTSPFFWLAPLGPAPTYRNVVLRKVWAEWDHGQYLEARANPIVLVRNLGRMLWSSFPFGYLPLFAFAAIGTRKARIALAIGGVFVVALLMEKLVLQHYLSPAIALVFLLAMLGWRWLFSQQRYRPRVGTGIAIVLYASLAGTVAMEARAVYDLAVSRPGNPYYARTAVVNYLMKTGPRHLVLVRYSPQHSLHLDWVRNGADIDGSPIVWAHDLGEAQDRELISYYQGRKVWLFEPDSDPVRLAPYRTN
ncbi:MAG TPA: hypothetical protein VFD69_14015 [Vicinamibacterales bacterium]|nr:hypothetical protein [Vicinamibacterales bacterium]